MWSGFLLAWQQCFSYTQEKKRQEREQKLEAWAGSQASLGCAEFVCLWDNREILAVVTATRKSRDRGTAVVLREMVLS